MAINVDYYLNRIRSTVTSVAAQVSSALPGNPVTRDYEVLSQIGSAGPALSWKIYAAQKRSTKKVYFFRTFVLEGISCYSFFLHQDLTSRGLFIIFDLANHSIISAGVCLVV